jgi:hypothetical protein
MKKKVIFLLENCMWTYSTSICFRIFLCNGMFCMHGCLVSHVLLMSCGKVGVSDYSLPTLNVMEPGPAVLTEVFHDYPESLQTDARIVPYSWATATSFHILYLYQYEWGGCTRQPMPHFLMYCASPSALFTSNPVLLPKYSFLCNGVSWYSLGSIKMLPKRQYLNSATAFHHFSPIDILWSILVLQEPGSWYLITCRAPCCWEAYIWRGAAWCPDGIFGRTAITTSLSCSLWHSASYLGSRGPDPCLQSRNVTPSASWMPRVEFWRDYTSITIHVSSFIRHCKPIVCVT